MKQVPEKDTLGHIAELFKGFADPTRVHILCLLLTEGELCVTEICWKIIIKTIIIIAIANIY